MVMTVEMAGAAGQANHGPWFFFAALFIWLLLAPSNSALLSCFFSFAEHGKVQDHTGLQPPKLQGGRPDHGMNGEGEAGGKEQGKGDIGAHVLLELQGGC